MKYLLLILATSTCLASPREVFEKTKDSYVTVSIRSVEPQYSTVGGGVIVSSHGYVLTSAHLMHDTDSVVVVNFPAKPSVEYVADVIKVNSVKDLMLVRIKENTHPVKLASTIHQAESVTVIGDPFIIFPMSVSAGVVSHHYRINDDGVRLGQTDALINPGNSGGPVLNEQGELIGIVRSVRKLTTSPRGIGFFVHVDEIKDFLKRVTL